MSEEPDIRRTDSIEREVLGEPTAETKRRKRRGKLLGRILSQLGFSQGRILDVGTRSGEVAIELALTFSGAEVVGIDAPGLELEVARAAAEEESLSNRVTVEVGDIQAMPFEDNSFDAVVSLETLHTVENPIALLDEIERVLVTNGTLVVGDIRRSWLALFMPVLRTAYTADEAKVILRRSKLRYWEFNEHLLWFNCTAGKSVDSLLKG